MRDTDREGERNQVRENQNRRDIERTTEKESLCERERECEKERRVRACESKNHTKVYIFVVDRY